MHGRRSPRVRGEGLRVTVPLWFVILLIGVMIGSAIMVVITGWGTCG